MCPDICPWADTVDISVVFSGYSGFLHQLNWPLKVTLNTITLTLYFTDIQTQVV
jgi:hypothetical protein